MFFSKITLTKDFDTVIKLDAYKQKTGYYYHQILWDLFSENNPDKKRDFIYHVQLVNQWPTFYIVSATEPVDTKEIWHIQSKPFNPQICVHETLHFKLRANPRICRKEGEQKKHFDIVQDIWFKNADKIKSNLISKNELMQTAGEKWLKQKAVSQNGFKVDTVIVDNFQKEIFKKKNHSISFSTLDFTGKLIVTDPGLFIRTLAQGIGSAKGFGCGLLMVKR
ncbi:MAG: type I-E CRISPR-associated protein Cas6/Cse3/CasE [Legionellales bacterium]|jgi:CRISPR system Cascade subunit CasE